ncbi:conserved membrane hypothetical protein [metagenome]|uniref:Uncharacterized protein n=1 Tax=metagenome TaxID=256318 RepID=A0A2P2CDP5_9ZZZZ
MTGPVWNVLRWAFLVAVVAGAWWSWRDSGDELTRALGQIGPGQVGLAAALVLAGLVITGAVWRVALGAFGTRGPIREVVPPFFVAQLGKYIPGSVWSFAAQGALGARRGLPPRVPTAAAVLFLGAHVASGLLLAGILGWWTDLPAWVVALSLLVGVIGLLPAVHRLVGRRVAGTTCEWGAWQSVVGALLMTPVWSCYALALAALTPDLDASLLLTLGCGFAVAHAVGVAVPIAPAGLGARDGVLVLLLAPALGTGPAGMVALTARLLHTVADFLLAGASWLVMRASDARQPSGQSIDDH